MGVPVEARARESIFNSVSAKEPVQGRVLGVDLDDSVLWREVFTRYFGHAKDLVFRPSLPKKTLDDIPKLDHSPVDRSIKGPKEIMSAFFHSRRTAIPGVAEKIREVVANKTPVYAISGRRATLPWFEMTEAQLIQENIPISSENIYLTPKGSSSLESKADCIRELGITEVIEDNRRTALYLAKLFPHVRIDYIAHGLANLSKRDLAENPNITVIPIEEVAIIKSVPEEESTVRNSELREMTSFADSAVEAFHKIKPFRNVKAWHVTALGVLFSIAGIELAEHQNRTGKHIRSMTVLAFSSSLIGATLDLLDGKLARVIRSEMIDDKAKDEDEARGGATDAAGDGIIEAWRAGSSAFTAKKKGNSYAVKAALFTLAITNLPRVAKAIVGCFGFKVPETYRIRDILHGDPRFFGVSFGRKFTNYPATLINEVEGVSVQAGMDTIGSIANGIVTAERLSAFITAKGERELSPKEMRHARTRALVLGSEALLFGGTAFILGKHLLGQMDKNKK